MLASLTVIIRKDFDADIAWRKIANERMRKRTGRLRLHYRLNSRRRVRKDTGGMGDKAAATEVEPLHRITEQLPLAR